MSEQNTYTFNISLSVLNHLGRNLYRNFVTVLGEAISNSWDADANNVWIYIDREKSELLVKDDGSGMSDEDFKNKFLKVGYSKRGNEGKLIKSPGGRPYIGRKGIGKLALLSCAKRVSVISKTSKNEYVGGIIDNSKLDNAITEDSTTYDLESIEVYAFKPHTDNHAHGTIILFEGIHEGINKSEEYLRKIVALYFKFSLVDSSFKIFLNDKEITESDLKSLAEKTQFLWNINTLDDPYITHELTKLRKTNLLTPKMQVEGFIASVEKPRYLKIVDTEEKTSIDLFVNGRLREQNILKHMPDFSTRHIASYLYGQIHFDELDGAKEDSFTTSRESIKEGDITYEKLLTLLRDEVLEKIDDEWDKWRLDEKDEGDDENPRKSPKARKARSLYNLSSREYEDPSQKSDVNKWIDELLPDAEFNIPAYVDCFLSENLIRKFILAKSTPLTKEALAEILKFKAAETVSRDKGNVSIDIRKINSDISYLSMDGLANLVDKDPTKAACLARDANEYKPIRDAIAHTALLTDVAKQKLSSVYENIKGRIRKLLFNGSTPSKQKPPVI